MSRQAKDVREQLSPIVEKLRETRSAIRPVSELTVRLKAIPGRDRFAATVDEILRWMNLRSGQPLPEAAWQRHSFELSDVGAQRTAAIALKEPRYWAARLDDADKNVPLRTWVTEIGVGVDANGDVLFGSRLTCTTRGTDEPFDRSIPRFVRAVLGSGEAELDGRQIRPTAQFVKDAQEVSELVSLLELPGRLGDVVVFSLPEGSDSAADALGSPNAVQLAVQGVAHVYVISGSASFLLTDAVGKPLSVFRQAVRIYRPGFRSWVDEPSAHPLILPARAETGGTERSQVLERWIVNQTLASSVHRPHREERLPAFNTVRQLSAQLERTTLKDAGGSDTELLRLFEEDNEQLRIELKEQREQYDGLLASADAEREAVSQAADTAKAQALERLNRIRVLEQRLAQLSKAEATAPPPTSLDGFDEWCTENLVGTVELAGRAYQGVRKSEYHDPQFIYQALLLLRDFYVPMRLESSPVRRAAYQKQLGELGLEESATGEGTKYAADLYSVQYGGRRRPLDRHLKRSDSRDRRFGFRLYFFWDEESQIVVVGWLPSHLDNRAS